MGSCGLLADYLRTVRGVQALPTGEHSAAPETIAEVVHEVTRPQDPQQRSQRYCDGVTHDATLASDIDTACRLAGSLLLRSGQVSNEYFDKYLFEAQPALLDRVATAMVELLPEGTELLGGPELGGVPIATMISAKTGLPALFVRKEAKEYGTAKLAEGPDVAGRRVLLVEDVITTGGAVRDAASALRELGALVETVVCAIDRSPEGKDNLGDAGLKVRSVLTKADLDVARAAALT
jgi:orotate phosphoribosyltransferase